VYPNDQVYENTYWDAPAHVEVTGDPSVTGILGVLAGPFHGLSLGASFRPPVPIHGEGTLTIEPTQMMEDFQVQVDGDRTEMELTLAPVLRVGARYDLSDLLGRTSDVELDYVWEGWSVVDEIVVTPDITTTATPPTGGDPIVIDVPEIRIRKDWEDVHALRFGAEVEVMEPVAVRAGYIYETNAIPERTASLDFANFGDRHVLTAGLGFRPIRAVEVNVAYAHVFQPDLLVDESEVRQTVTDPGTNPNVVGNGAYETSYDILTAGVTLRFNQF
jgi:long-subunit fatty acid transport protein